jgi:tetratricopeptide (TPR) repeat protein
LTSHTVQSSLGDLFRLQDDIAHRVADAIVSPLTGGPVSPASGITPDARAYELYLRANELARTYNGLIKARDLYQSSLELDSRFAPAWAYLGRCHRVIGKYIDASDESEARAEEALRRALALSPRLTIAHKFFANLEADMGRAQDALVRLLGEAERHGNDPELFAGLVHACRYCGLFEQSIAAHTEARRLDPNVPTSIEQTLLMTGNIDRLLAIEPPRLVAGADDGIRVIGLGLAGRRDEARAKLVQMRQLSRIPAFESWIDYLTAWLDRRRTEMDGRMSVFRHLKIQEDPEAIFQEGWLLCDLDDDKTGLDFLRRAIEKRYWVVDTLMNSRQFDRLRNDREFQALVARASEGRERALIAYRDAGGERLLGV